MPNTRYEDVAGYLPGARDGARQLASWVALMQLRQLMVLFRGRIANPVLVVAFGVAEMVAVCVRTAWPIFSIRVCELLLSHGSLTVWKTRDITQSRRGSQRG